MSKTVKKRHKPYRGADAASRGPRVTRYRVSEESILRSWWKEHKSLALSRLLLVLAALLVSWVIYQIIG